MTYLETALSFLLINKVMPVSKVHIASQVLLIPLLLPKSNKPIMEKNKTKTTKIYLVAMGIYWTIFGLITIFYPNLMDMFQTGTGVNAKTEFSNHVWLHGGFDIIALCVLLFALSGETVSRRMLRATALAALMPTIAIAYSLITTLFWNSLFIGAGLGCFAFVVWGFALASKAKN